MKNKIFIGSSSETKHIAKNIKELLEKDDSNILGKVWSDNVFKPSNYALDSLIKVSEECKYGIFIFAPDDTANIRNKEKDIVRDNVIFELGLFVSKLGREKCLILVPSNSQNFHIPTDLQGVTYINYEIANDNEWIDTLSTTVNQILRYMRNGTKKKNDFKIQSKLSGVFQSHIDYTIRHCQIEKDNDRLVFTYEKDGQNKVFLGQSLKDNLYLLNTETISFLYLFMGTRNNSYALWIREYEDGNSKYPVVLQINLFDEGKEQNNNNLNTFLEVSGAQFFKSPFFDKRRIINNEIVLKAIIGSYEGYQLIFDSERNGQFHRDIQPSDIEDFERFRIEIKNDLSLTITTINNKVQLGYIEYFSESNSIMCIFPDYNRGEKNGCISMLLELPDLVDGSSSHNIISGTVQRVNSSGLYTKGIYLKRGESSPHLFTTSNFVDEVAFDSSYADIIEAFLGEGIYAPKIASYELLQKIHSSKNRFADFNDMVSSYRNNHFSNSIELLILDLSGTILDILHADREVLNDISLEFENKTYYALKEQRKKERNPKRNDWSMEENFKILFGKNSKQAFQQYSSRLIKKINSENNNISLFKGAKDSLCKLKERGVRVVVLTNRRRNILTAIIKKFNLDECIDNAYSAIDDLNHFKPQKQSIEKILIKESLKGNLEKENIIFVGNTEVDISCADSYGCQSVLFKEKLSYSNIDFIQNRIRQNDPFALRIVKNYDEFMSVIGFSNE